MSADEERRHDAGWRPIPSIEVWQTWVAQGGRWMRLPIAGIMAGEGAWTEQEGIDGWEEWGNDSEFLVRPVDPVTFDYDPIGWGIHRPIRDAMLDLSSPPDAIMLINGSYFRLLADPVDVSMVTPEVLAYGLAGVSRFAAHVRPRTNVACHSYHVSVFAQLEAPRFGEDPFIAALQGLLHDGSDALGFGDIPGHLKRHPAYAKVWAAEKRVQEALYRRWGLLLEKLRSVEEADKRMQATEMVLCEPRRTPKVEPYPDLRRSDFMTPEVAEGTWLRTWNALELEAARRGMRL